MVTKRCACDENSKKMLCFKGGKCLTVIYKKAVMSQNGVKSQNTE